MGAGTLSLQVYLVYTYYLSLLLTSLVAHDRAKEDTHKHHTGKEHKNIIIIMTLNVGTVHKLRQGSINSAPL